MDRTRISEFEFLYAQPNLSFRISDKDGDSIPPGEPLPPRQALALVTPALNKDEALHL
jgi:hypothetical protein